MIDKHFITYHASLTLKSRNDKTGNIPVSITSKASCPKSCPLKGNGCYAECGPLALHWRKVSEGMRGMPWNDFCRQIESLPKGTLWRHNQAGDLPSVNGETIHWSAMHKLVSANAGKRGFTYTHYDVVSEDSKGLANLTIVKWANDCGFTVNLSADNLEDADIKAETGLPVVCVLPEKFPDKGETPAGRKVIVCPAQTGMAENCKACGLCAKPERKVIVGFRVHGTQKARAAQALDLI